MILKNSIVLSLIIKIHFIALSLPWQAKYLTRNTMAGSVEAIKSLDDFLLQLAVSVVEQPKCKNSFSFTIHLF